VAFELTWLQEFEVSMDKEVIEVSQLHLHDKILLFSRGTGNMQEPG